MTRRRARTRRGGHPTLTPLDAQPSNAVVVIAAAATFVCFATQVWVSLAVAAPAEHVKTLLATCDTITKMGAGAFITSLTARSRSRP